MKSKWLSTSHSSPHSGENVLMVKEQGWLRHLCTSLFNNSSSYSNPTNKDSEQAAGVWGWSCRALELKRLEFKAFGSELTNQVIIKREQNGTHSGCPGRGGSSFQVALPFEASPSARVSFASCVAFHPCLSSPAEPPPIIDLNWGLFLTLPSWSWSHSPVFCQPFPDTSFPLPSAQVWDDLTSLLHFWIGSSYLFSSTRHLYAVPHESQVKGLVVSSA